jgi:acyl dehydratase
MEISSSLVGTSLAAYHTEVSWRQLMNYAAAIHDDNPVYFDDQRKEGILGHPMFCVAITWPILENLVGHLETDAFPREVLSTQVHHTEYLCLRRPVRPGDHLMISGKIAAISPHRAGTVMLIRLDASDSSQRLVFTEFTGALLRGVQCSDEGKWIETLPAIPENPCADGPLWQSRISIDPMQTYLYDGCTNIFFPIHTSRRFAREVGLPGIIVQGTATLAHAVRELINREAQGQPSRLKHLHGRFTHMVFPGAIITVRLQGAADWQDGRALFFDVLNDKGQTALSRGYALMEN